MLGPKVMGLERGRTLRARSKGRAQYVRASATAERRQEEGRGILTHIL